MPQLLIEFFSEEIPARMQKRAEEDLARLLGEKLKAAGLTPNTVATYSGPRRLAIVIDDLPAKTPDVREERKGPRVGAPEQALAGFLKGAGLASIDQAKVQNDTKGDFYFAVIEKAGADTAAVVAQAIPEIARAFPWPKSMRSRSYDLQWVRPLHNVLVVFDRKHVPVSIEGVKSEAITWGHRFHSKGAIEVADFASYERGLRAGHVLIDREARKKIILDGAREVCAAKKLELVEDVGLLEEVAGLAEWPVVLLGDMDPAFLDLPGEVIRLSMRTHQKYFAVRDPKSGKLAPHFVVVANIAAKDGGDAIAAGNARVLSARLNDARFFWDGDRKTPLYTDERRAKLEKIVFHQKLGSVWDKVERVRALAVELCSVTKADPDLVRRAADLCKMDLVTEIVGEFPELQGQIGRQLYLAELSAPPPREGRGQGVGSNSTADAARQDSARSASPRPLTPSPQGEGESVAAAIEDHYRPLGPNDRVPSDPVAVTLALADKLDALVGFFAIDEKPTGSSDAYALRRAALGVVRVLLNNNVRLKLKPKLRQSALFYYDRLGFKDRSDGFTREVPLVMVDGETPQRVSSRRVEVVALDILAFLADRLKVQLREQGKRHDLVDAVFAPNPITQKADDDLVRIVARVEALDAFLKTEDGKNLLAGYKRAANILRAEEKKNAELSTRLLKSEVQIAQLKEDEEKSLHNALERARPAAEKAVASEDFAAAMQALAQLRTPVDKFFDTVLVNADDENLRLNRLTLLSRIRDALHAVADFSKIEG